MKIMTTFSERLETLLPQLGTSSCQLSAFQSDLITALRFRRSEVCGLSAEVARTVEGAATRLLSSSMRQGGLTDLRRFAIIADLPALEPAAEFHRMLDSERIEDVEQFLAERSATLSQADAATVQRAKADLLSTISDVKNAAIQQIEALIA